MLEFNNVSKIYRKNYTALTDVSFRLEPGEFAFLTGPSGAGKSTLLKLIALLAKPTFGEILVNGRVLSQFEPTEVAYYRRDLGLVFQEHHLLLDRSVAENVALPLIIAGYHDAEVKRRVRAALDKVGLTGKEHLNPQFLSGGEQQRVGIARAVVNKPKFLLADEPTGNLDPKLASEIMELFKQFSQIGVCVLIATHDPSLLTRYAHRVLSLEHGQLVEDSRRRRATPSAMSDVQQNVQQDGEQVYVGA